MKAGLTSCRTASPRPIPGREEGRRGEMIRSIYQVDLSHHRAPLPGLTAWSTSHLVFYELSERPRLSKRIYPLFSSLCCVRSDIVRVDEGGERSQK